MLFFRWKITRQQTTVNKDAGDDGLNLLDFGADRNLIKIYVSISILS